jgi:hypothetical protein
MIGIVVNAILSSEKLDSVQKGAKREQFPAARDKKPWKCTFAHETITIHHLKTSEIGNE